MVYGLWYIVYQSISIYTVSLFTMNPIKECLAHYIFTGCSYILNKSKNNIVRIKLFKIFDLKPNCTMIKETKND